MNKFLSFILVTIAFLTANARTIELTQDNSVLFKGVVTSQAVEKASQKLHELDLKRGQANYPLYLVLDSPGGSIDSGNDFIEFAKSIKNLETLTIFSASMASAIVEQLPGKRLMIETGLIMFHRAKGGFEGQFETGEVESELDMAKQIVVHMEKKNADRMGLSLATYKTLVVNEMWLFGPNAVSKKAVDEVVTVTCSNDVILSSSSVEVMTFFGPVTLDFSACPLLKGYTVKNPEESKRLKKHLELIKGLKNGEIKN